MNTVRRNLTPIFVALITLGALVPIGAGQGAEGAACTDVIRTGRYISLGHPLAEQGTASQIAYLIVGESAGLTKAQKENLNGIDGYVIDLGCVVLGTAGLCVEGTDHGIGAYDLGVVFLTSTLRQLETVHDPSSPDVCDGSFTAPVGSQYAVVILFSGVPAAGLTPGLPTRPYSARFNFELDR